MRVARRSPNDTSESLARGVRSCMMQMPMSSCCSSLSIFSTSALTVGSTRSSSHVSMCSLRSASRGGRLGMLSMPSMPAFSARSPHSSSMLVLLPIADRTTTGSRSGKEQMMSATSRMRSASRTEEPPNLYTTLACCTFLPGATSLVAGAAGAAAAAVATRRAEVRVQATCSRTTGLETTAREVGTAAGFTMEAWRAALAVAGALFNCMLILVPNSMDP
mmetsp:Transcript_14260/g.35227  ORF Transcript_14260/g.35227 Transcript_14260/m.35227 type:complete len:219 (-) Transcript_14260:36-692(-)